ncbi:hypothetical protein [Acidocella sp.]|uniref:hypothetical protein n=1 Tax=Acidocella sp. TaxID=50710 RepID=UPI00260D5307|nr:hypothetical protein [Acidocella sp.]MDD2794349.1 hypothetical protein [Acidocella sp.]
MPNTTTVSAATASGTVSLAAIVILQWVLSLKNISLPADVATALATVLAAGVHFLVARKVLPAPAAAAPEVAKPVPAVPVSQS